MNVPKPRKLKSGNWFIQMRLGGESISITAPTSAACTKEAMLVKAEHKAGKRVLKEDPGSLPARSLDQAIKNYCESKSNVLSPATIRGYQNIRKNQFKDIMQKNIYELSNLSKESWQKIINKEAAKYSPKTLKNSVGLIKTVIEQETGRVFPDVRLSFVSPSDTNFLTADEIPIFVEKICQTDVAVPALLALSSMRLSEIQALDWKSVKKNPDFIRTNGAVVPDENNQFKHKKQNKNASSSRDVPILIPELKKMIERERKTEGPIMSCSRSHFLKQVHKTCQNNNITDVTIHGLRHSFASLAHHLNVPEKIAQEIGGWSDSATMRKIYTHIAKKDITRYQEAFSDFYEKSEKNANKNANDPPNH